MKKSVVILSVLLVCAAFGAKVYQSMDPPPVLTFGPGGLASLRYRGVQFLEYGDLRVSHVVLRETTGRTFAAPAEAPLQVDAAVRTVTRKYPWGEVEARFTPKPGRLNIAMTVRNRSPHVIQDASYEPLALHFPARVTEYDGATPLVGHNDGDPTVISMSWPSGKLVLANDDVERPLISGFPWALDKPANATFPVRICIGRDPMLPDVLPNIDRPIAPGASDTYNLSLRFGSSEASVAKLAGDVLHISRRASLRV